MEGMLSQDEINALLSGMGSSSDSTDTASDMSLAQQDVEDLTEQEKDAIGEVANISMGSSATTLYSLVNKKVNITTPVVAIATWENVMEYYHKPCVFIQIKYTAGLDGNNILILKEHDVKVITDLMMGGDGLNTDGELGELHLSAISEAMNQMMGSAATSLSTMMDTVIDISPPEATLVDLNEVKMKEELASFLSGAFVKISFRMQIDGLVDSTLLQLYPIDFAKNLYNRFVGVHEQKSPKAAPPIEEKPALQPDMSGMNMQGMQSMNNMQGMNMQGMNNMSGMNNMQGMGMQGMNNMQGMGMQGMNNMSGMDMSGMNMQGMNMPGMNMQGMGMQGMNMPGMNMSGMGYQQPQSINFQPAQFQNFSTDYSPVPGQENIGLIMDVPLEVTVELGRASKSISEILSFSPGTIIELDKIAGEPIDVLVNGKFVAKGEVVVIEESFGVRVTEIIK